MVDQNTEHKNLAATCAELTLAGLERAVQSDHCTIEQKRRGLDALCGLAYGDCYYDEPSIGLHYAFWHHLQRAVGLLVPLKHILRSHVGHPLRILDLGHGTGPATTALAALSHYLPLKQPMQVRLVGLDQSEIMLRTARAMLSDHEPSTLHLEVQWHRGSWLDGQLMTKLNHRLNGEATVLLGSYVFDNSDVDKERIKVLTYRMARLANAADADDVILLGGSSKLKQTRAIAKQLTSGDLAGARYDIVTDWVRAPMEVMSVPQQETIRQLRSAWLKEAAMQVSHGPLLRRAPPLQDEDLRYSSLHREPLRLDFTDSDPWPWLLLDEQQRAAVTAMSSSGPLLIQGAAGSGKSLVLIERLARAFEKRPNERYLLTTFNKLMAEQLYSWLQLRLSAAGLAGGGDDGWFRLLRDGQEVILIANRDKLPTRVLGCPGREAQAFHHEAARNEVAQRGGADALRRWDGLLIHHGREFPEHEMEAFIYGQDVRSLSEYLALPRAGAGTPLGQRQRKLVWHALMEMRQITWGHWRRAAYDDYRKRLADPSWRHAHGFAKVFVDEAQDFSQADFDLLNRLVRTPADITLAGDPTQAVHLGGAWQRPRLVHGDGNPANYAAIQRLESSYRLPWLVARAIEPLARDVDAEAVAPRPERAAVAGPRIIVVAGASVGNGVFALHSSIRQVLAVHDVARLGVADRKLFEALRRDRSFDAVELVDSRPKVAKGVEFDAVLVNSHTPGASRDRARQELYTSLTRSTRVLVLVIDPATQGHLGRFLRVMQSQHLMFWDESAERAWNVLPTADKVLVDE